MNSNIFLSTVYTVFSYFTQRTLEEASQSWYKSGKSPKLWKRNIWAIFSPQGRTGAGWSNSTI